MSGSEEGSPDSKLSVDTKDDSGPPPAGTVATNNETLEYAFRKIFGMGENATTQALNWLLHKGLESPMDLTIQLASNPACFKDPKYQVPSTTGKTKGMVTKELPQMALSRIAMLARLIRHLHVSSGKFPSNMAIMTITSEDMTDFLRDGYLNEVPTPPPLKTPPNSNPYSTPRQAQNQTHVADPDSQQNTPGLFGKKSPEKQLLHQQKKAIKLDASAFPKLKDERYMDSFWRGFKAIATTFQVQNVLDPHYHPATPDAQELFDFQNQWMYGVCVNSFLSENTATFVREHDSDQNAQRIISKFLNYRKNSTKAKFEIKRLVRDLTHLKLDSGWNGTCEDFLLILFNFR